MEKGKRGRAAAAGLVSGFLNGLFGSGGGIAAVLLLRALEPDERRVHATATLLMLALSAVSLGLYAAYGQVDWRSGLRFVPGGLAGAALGALLLRKIRPAGLRRLFGAVMVISGLLMLRR